MHILSLFLKGTHFFSLPLRNLYFMGTGIGVYKTSAILFFPRFVFSLTKVKLKLNTEHLRFNCRSHLYFLSFMLSWEEVPELQLSQTLLDIIQSHFCKLWLCYPFLAIQPTLFQHL